MHTHRHSQLSMINCKAITSFYFYHFTSIFIIFDMFETGDTSSKSILYPYNLMSSEAVSYSQIYSLFYKKELR